MLTDHRGYAAITPLRKVELERAGDPAPNGVGAIRVLHAVGPPTREEVLVYDRPRRFSYKLLSGAPVRDHVGTVTLEPDGAGTRVVYTISTTPTVPFGGAAVVAVAKVAVGRLLKSIVAEAERGVPVAA